MFKKNWKTLKHVKRREFNWFEIENFENTVKMVFMLI